MIPKIYIGIGHGGNDGGAIAPGGQTEKDINLAIGLAVADYLQNYEVQVMLSRNNDVGESVTEKTIEANNFGADLAVEIHNNAGGGDGFEAYYQTNSYSEKSLKIGKSIETEIIGIGQNSRGLKYRFNSYGADYYGFLRMVKCPAVLLECAFLDNANDYAQIDEAHERKAFGEAIAKGIVNYLGLSPKFTTTWYKVQIGAFRTKALADAYLDKAITDGYKGFVIESEV